MAATYLGALVAAFDASPAFGAVAQSQGLWVGEVPEQISDQALPFVALVHDGDFPEYTTEAQYKENVNFHFEIYAVGLAAAEALAWTIKTAFDKPGTNEARAAFTVANATVVRCCRYPGRKGYQVDVVGERVSTGEKVYVARLFYVFEVGATL